MVLNDWTIIGFILLLILLYCDKPLVEGVDGGDGGDGGDGNLIEINYNLFKQNLCDEFESGVPTCINDDDLSTVIGLTGNECRDPQEVLDGGYIFKNPDNPDNPDNPTLPPRTELYSEADGWPWTADDNSIIQGCNDASGWERSDDTLGANACDSHDTPYSITGCRRMCSKSPSSQRSTLGLGEQYSTDKIYSASPSRPYISNSDDYTPLETVTCGENASPAQNKCFYPPNNGNSDNLPAYSNTTDGGGCDGDGIHMNNDGIKGVCIDMGNDKYEYSFMGCVNNCESRDNYLFSEDDTDPYKETIYINGVRVIDNGKDIFTIPKLSNLGPDTFNVGFVEGTGVACARSLHFGTKRTDFGEAPNFLGQIPSPCNPETTDKGTFYATNKYKVSGCFPTCPEGKKCININLNYDLSDDNINKAGEWTGDTTPSDEINAAPDYNTFKSQLMDTINATLDPGDHITSLDPGGPLTLTFYRRYTHVKKQYIEAQLQCSDTNCEIITAALNRQLPKSPGS